jgi:hypothetical protein
MNYKLAGNRWGNKNGIDGELMGNEQRNDRKRAEKLQGMSREVTENEQINDRK